MSWSAADIPDQTGRVAVVTGGNGGLGLETVRELARTGATVVIGARNLDKAARAEADVRTGVPDATLEVRKLDLSSLASIGEFADAVTADHDAVDLLFNNAGVMATPEGQTADGFETQFGTNHLGHFLFTALAMTSRDNALPHIRDALQWVIPIVGLTVAALTFLGVRAAYGSITNIKNHWFGVVGEEIRIFHADLHDHPDPPKPEVAHQFNETDFTT